MSALEPAGLVDGLHWLLSHAGDGPVHIVAHNDADGLAAAGVLLRGLGARTLVEPRLVGRFEDPWRDPLQSEIRAAAPAALVVTDLGIRAEPVVPATPTLVIDHHVPRGAPSDRMTRVISGYDRVPVPSSSVLAWQALGEPADLAWLAAIGAIGDYGDREAAARFPGMMRAAAVGNTKTALRAATSLLNAPRRSSQGDASPALRVLLAARRAVDVTSGTHPESPILEAARDEVAAELTRARKVAPQFAGRVALLCVESRCQVHPLVAQTWAGRLRTSIVMAANTGFRDGVVHFAVRAAADIDLIAFLREHTPPGASGDMQFAGGHLRATGGALAVPIWKEFLTRLGFSPAVCDPGRQRSETELDSDPSGAAVP